MLNKKSISIAAVAVLALAFSIGAQSNWWPFSKDKNEAASKGPTTELTWEDLIPDDFIQPENPFLTMSEDEVDRLMDGSDESNAEIARLEKEFNYAPVVPELDGKRVKIPAYITPLEYDGQTNIKEFLLVPYVGACIHTPPPPANQILHTVSAEAVENPGMYEPVWAIGTISTETVKSQLAESGYRLQLEELLPYAPE